MAYILRAQSLGKKSMPYLGELLSIPVYTSDQSIKEDDYAFRWGCTSKNLGKTKVVNKIDAIDTASDKKGFRKVLFENGLAPGFWSTFDEYIDGITPERLIQRVLVRPAFHQRSQSIFDCTTLLDVKKACSGLSEYYISEFIDKQKEFRVMVCSNRVLWMIDKHPKDSKDVTWGCVQDGEFDYVDWSAWPDIVTECALKSMKLSGLDFGALDIIVKDGRAYCLEINTAPWLSPYYNKCVAKAFKYIIKNGREHFPDLVDYRWDLAIHPAIKQNLENI